MSAPFNPPAFPCEAQGDRSVPPEHDYIQTGIYSSKFPGMSLRDYFAGQAIPGILNDQSFREAFTADLGPKDFAAAAYDIADAMLAHRSDCLARYGEDIFGDGL